MRLSLKRCLLITYLNVLAFLSLIHYFFSVNNVYWSFLSNNETLSDDQVILNERANKAIWPEDLVGILDDQVLTSSSLIDRIQNQLEFYDPNKTSVYYQKDKKLIVYLPDGISSWNVLAGDSQFNQCRADNCLLVDQHVENYNAAMFRNYIRKSIKRTSPDQVWIFYTLESPYHSTLSNHMDHVINWTATYRLDSDIVTPYEKFILFTADELRFHNKSGHNVDSTAKNYASGKDRLIAWFVSNCMTNNDRRGYASQLAQFIQVDVYGACGDLTCSKYYYDDDQDKTCFNMLKNRYKFYLSFENSNCRDYITEKFFLNALQNDVLPIVMGAPKQDYLKVAPPNSFVHIDDFETPEKLAQYLHLLNNNDTMYNEYFQWKSTGRFIDTKFWCRLCAMLNKPRRKSYADLVQWWNGEGTCVEHYSWRKNSSKADEKRSSKKFTNNNSSSSSTEQPSDDLLNL